MSKLASTQIPIPGDEQAFERCNVVLWRCILKDETVKRHGRKGQAQYGVDLTGLRDGNPNHIVGVQCKLKGHGKILTEKEVKCEVEKALTFRPLLSEYIIVTTAPDDGKLDRLCHELSITESEDREKEIKISVFGWGSMESEIISYPEARRAFGLPETVSGEWMEDRMDIYTDEIAKKLNEKISPKFDAMQSAVESLQTVNPTIGISGAHTEQESQINDCIELMVTDPSGALTMLSGLERRLTEDTPGRIRFRVVSNMAVCQLKLGHEDIAAQGFIDAWELHPDDPQAASNKAFGLFLKEDWPALCSFTTEQLQIHQESGALAGYHVYGLIFDESIEDPLAQVPEDVLGTAEVAEARIQWLMKRAEAGAWWEPAITACAVHPDHRGLMTLGASALLDRALAGGALYYGKILSDAEISDVKKAIDTFETLWTGILDGVQFERRSQASVPINLMIACLLLGENEKAVEVGTEAVEHYPEDSSIKEHLAVIHAEQGEFERALDLISGLQPSRQTVSVCFNIALACEEWDRVQRLLDDHPDCFPESDKYVALAVRVRADVEQAPLGQRREIMETAENGFEKDVRASIVLARTARVHQWSDLADQFFALSRAALENDGGGLASRISVAEEAMARHEPNIAADVLIGHIPIERNGPELQLLAQALVNDCPIRDRAVRFFENLPPDVQSLSIFKKLEGALHFNRGAYRDAIEPFLAVQNDQPSIENLMRLVRAYYAADEKEPIAALLQSDEIDALPGPSLERIEFCHVLLDFEQGARALDLGYRILVDSLDDAQVVGKFLGLILKPSPNRPVSSTIAVDNGVWIHLTSSMGEKFQALIGETHDRPWGEMIDPDNAFIRKSMGLKIGESFELQNIVTEAVQTWTVTEVKPFWLQAFHHLIRTFGQQFPDALGITSVPIKEDNIEPALDLVRRYSEEKRERADLYLVNNLPIAFVSGGERGDSISFAEYLVTIGEEVRVCYGSEDERSAALDLIDDHNQSGAVLDGLTAWYAAALDILPVLSELLGSLSIPTSEIQWLDSMVEEMEVMASTESMTLAYTDGKYVRDVRTVEEQTENLALVKSRIKAIKEACTVEPLVIPDNLSEHGEALVRSPSGNALGPAILAGKERILLSEDMFMRRLANEVFDARGVWLQAVLLSALRSKKMNLDVYSDALVYLTAFRHGYVSLDTPVLHSIFERDTGNDLHRLESLCAYVGNENAEPVSHIRIAAGFINDIRAKGMSSDFRINKATNLIFRSLLYRHRGENWADWAALLIAFLDEEPRIALQKWCKGHFLPFSDILKVLE